MKTVKTEQLHKEAKGDKTRQRLFDAARKLYSEHEFNEVTVERIAREAGVAKGTFYIYFESKDNLIADFMNDHVNSVDSDYRSAIAACGPEASSEEMLLALIEKIADELTDTIGCQAMAIIYKLLLGKLTGVKSVKDYDRDLYLLFTSLIERGIQRGELSTPLSAEALARHFVLAMRGLTYEWCIRYPDFDLKSQALSHFQILLNGVKKPLYAVEPEEL